MINYRPVSLSGESEEAALRVDPSGRPYAVKRYQGLSLRTLRFTQDTLRGNYNAFILGMTGDTLSRKAFMHWASSGRRTAPAVCAAQYSEGIRSAGVCIRKKIARPCTAFLF